MRDLSSCCFSEKVLPRAHNGANQGDFFGKDVMRPFVAGKKNKRDLVRRKSREKEG